jgi:uncharacterized membrane protein
MSRRNKPKIAASTSAPTAANGHAASPQLANAVRQVVLQQLYQGPLPHPDMLAKFEALYPGASKLLFEQFKAQGDHRMEIENKVIEGNIRSSRLGQWMAYSICMTALVGGGILVCFGIRTEGLIASVAGLGILVAVFITGKLSGQKELKAKRQ